MAATKHRPLRGSDVANLQLPGPGPVARRSCSERASRPRAQSPARGPSGGGPSSEPPCCRCASRRGELVRCRPQPRAARSPAAPAGVWPLRGVRGARRGRRSAWPHPRRGDRAQDAGGLPARGHRGRACGGRAGAGARVGQGAPDGPGCALRRARATTGRLQGHLRRRGLRGDAGVAHPPGHACSGRGELGRGSTGTALGGCGACASASTRHGGSAQKQRGGSSMALSGYASPA